MRVYQYENELRKLGIDCDVRPLLGERYLDTLYDGRPLAVGDVLRSYGRRLFDLRARREHDVLWVQKELLPFVPGWIEKRLHGPFVYDIDDAWHLRYSTARRRLVRMTLADKVTDTMRRASVVVAGNSYLEEVSRKAGAQDVRVVPSVVPVGDYEQRPLPCSSKFVVAWIGSRTTVPYLNALRPVLEELGERCTLEVIVMGADMERGANFSTRCIPWSEKDEKIVLGSCHVGVMPLNETEWELGKCAYKAVQYMAAGRPVVATAVGANNDVVEHGRTGFLVNAPAEWLEALATIAADRKLNAEMGAGARRRATEEYSVEAQAPRLAAALRAASM